MSKQTRTPKPGNDSKGDQEAYRTGWSTLSTACERINNNTSDNSQTTVATSFIARNNSMSSLVPNSPLPKEPEISGMERLININTIIDARKQAAPRRKRVQTTKQKIRQTKVQTKVQTPQVSCVDNLSKKDLRGYRDDSKRVREAYRTGWSTLSTAWERRNNNTSDNSQTTVATSSFTHSNSMSSQLRVPNSPPPQKHEISEMERLINMNTVIDAKRQAEPCRKWVQTTKQKIAQTKVQTPQVSCVDKLTKKFLKGYGHNSEIVREAYRTGWSNLSTAWERRNNNTRDNSQTTVTRTGWSTLSTDWERRNNNTRDNSQTAVTKSSFSYNNLDYLSVMSTHLRVPNSPPPQKHENSGMERLIHMNTAIDAKRQAEPCRKRVQTTKQKIIQTKIINNNNPVEIIRSAGIRIPQRPEASEDVDLKRPDTYSTLIQNTDAEKQAAVRQNF